MSFKIPSLFRALSAYRMTADVEAFHDLKVLNEALRQKPERQPTFHELTTVGWRPTLAARLWMKSTENSDPDGFEDEMDQVTFANAPDGRPGNLIHLELIRWERQVPSWEVKNRLRDRIDRIENNEMRKVYKKERDQLKDEVVQDIMKQAFVKASVTQALILPEHKLILIDCASPRKCDDLLSTLREAIGSLPVRPIRTKLEPCVTMTAWLREKEAAHGFEMLDGLVMQDDEKGRVGMVHQDITDDVVTDHLSHGLQATKLALMYKEMAFLLEQTNKGSGFSIRKLYHSDMVADQFYASNGEDCHPITENNGLHLLQADSLRNLVTDLVEALGGEDVPKQI